MLRCCCCCLLVLVYAAVAPLPEARGDQVEASGQLTIDKLGATRNVHRFEKTLLCGQPSAKEFRQAKNRGIEVVITLRQSGEIDWDEEAVVKQLGMEFHQFGFGAPEMLTDEIFDATLKLLANAKKKPVMLHCASANRVGGIWLAHRVINDGIDVQAARKEAKLVGLRTAGYEEKALAYIKKRNAERE